ncbi:MAG: 23S rRNA (adenine(2030)-N(6))-methyltransferase RlmJ [Bauldia sp.]|nr:23S rRNA (adenine(2030)-N(6))-methyltransferase RlmJ [Bauldia sp.]
MNYRHLYHAGNHADVFKHAILAQLILHLRLKPKPFVVIDTHAGLGRYDLLSVEALKTGEAADGIGRALGAAMPAAEPFLTIVRGMNPGGGLAVYPGSAAVARALLREDDRLVASELHPDDHLTLRRQFRHDPQVAIHHRDGYETLLAFIPPPERRGLVLIDPPYEERDEPARLGAALVAAMRKWPTGMFAAWYPVKDRTTLAPLFAAVDGAGFEGIVAEFLRHEEDGIRFAGSGLVILNPPWHFETTASAIQSELRDALGAPAQKPVRRLRA